MKYNIFISLFLLFFSSQLLISEKVWYRSQISTGLGNCGPAVVAMAIQWATENKTYVEEIREIIGYYNKDGATSLDDFKPILKKKNIFFYTMDIDGPFAIKKYIDSKAILIVLLTMSGISNRKDKFAGKHFVIISGYEDEYFIIQDPLNGSDVKYKVSEVSRVIELETLVIFR